MARSPYGPRRGGGILDVAVAALAGGSVAFATFAMPDALFAQIVVASRLPDLLPAAQPPLGDTARWSAVAAAGLATAFLVWALLRALDHVPAGRRSQTDPAPADENPLDDAPRVRRADAHPDAPARRPLRAGQELGEPSEEESPPVEDMLDLVEEAPEERFADLTPQPLPGFLVPQEAEEVAEAGEPDKAGESLEALSAQLPDADEGRGKSIGDLMQRLEGGLSRRQRNPAEEAAAPPVATAPAEVPQAAAPPVATAPAEVPQAAAPPVAPAPAEVTQAAAPPKPSRTPLDLSPPGPPPAEEIAPAEDRIGHRLRSAINDLQKLSGHG